MRDLYVLEAFTDDGLTVRTGPHTIAEAMAVVDEHLAPRDWRHRYLPITPTEQALRHFNPGRQAGRPVRPVLEADFFVALRRAIITDPEHDGLDSVYVPAMLAHVDPHRPWQLYQGDEECLLHECGHPRDVHGACEGMEPAERVCVACTAIIDSNTEFGPYIACRVSWPCSVISSAARQYNVGFAESAGVVA